MKIIFIDFQDIGSGGFGTLGLATLLRRCGHDAHVIGSSDVVTLLNDEQKLRGILKTEQPDYVGLSVMTPYADYIDRMAKLVKETVPNAIVLVGGYHPSIYGALVLNENSLVDYVFTGDADHSLPEFIERREGISSEATEDIPGVIGRSQLVDGCGKVENLKNSGLPSGRTLDHLPYPDELTIHPAYYSKTLRHGHPSVPAPSRYVLFSRGCPYKCTFCQIEDDGGFRSKVRVYSAGNAVETLGELQERFGLRGVAFLDDNFTIDKNWAHEVCEGIIKANLKLEWWAQIRPNLGDENLMRLMREAGCKVATITIESGNDRIRNEVLGKRVTRKQISDTYAMAKKYGMLTQGTLLMGSPTETYEELMDSIEFLREMNPDWAGVCMTTPLPGTALHRIYKGEIKTTRYRDYDINLQSGNRHNGKVKLSFHKIDPDKLYEAYEAAREEFRYKLDDESRT